MRGPLPHENQTSESVDERTHLSNGKLFGEEHDQVQKDISCETSKCSTAGPGQVNCSQYSENKQLFILGCDIDKVLIQRATEANPYPENITFQEVDIMDLTNSSKLFVDFLATHQSAGLFDLTTCFSITMWIHLHHGDQGLMTFLHEIAKRTRYLLIEPQPWKCYKSAVRRMKKLKLPIEWLSLNDLGINKDVVEKIETYLVTECNMEIVQRLGETEWERQLLLLRNISFSSDSCTEKHAAVLK